MRRIACVLLIGALSVPILAQEKLALTAPIAKNTTEWTLSAFTIDADNKVVIVVVKDNIGERKEVRYPNATATQTTTNTLLTSINTYDQSVTGKTLKRWLLERLQTDGHLGAGAVSGGN